VNRFHPALFISLAAAVAWGAEGAAPEPRAAALYREGLSHYRLAEYDEAIRAFKEAYRLAPAPELLFDIAQSLRRKGPGNCGLALDFYTNYLGTEPNAALRARAVPLRDEVKRCALSERPISPPPEPSGLSTSQAPEPVPVPTLAPAPLQTPPLNIESVTRRPGHSDVLLWSLVMGGTLAAAGGGVLVYSVRWSDSCSPFCSPSQVRVLEARAYTGYALLGVGGAAAVAGLALWLWPHGESRAAFLSPTLNGLVVRGEF
jgi:tetratricopeptide (TPR) repeat protein